MGVMNLPQALRLAGHLHVSQISGPQYAHQRARIRDQHRQQDARADRRPHRLLPGLRRRVLGNAGRRHPGHRAHRGHARARRQRLGRQRRQRRDQRDHQDAPPTPRAPSSTCPRARACSGPYAVRHGGRLGSAGAYRAYAKVRFEDSHQLVSGADAHDDFDFGQAGFRIESDPSAPIAVRAARRHVHRHDRTVERPPKPTSRGGNLLGRWTLTDGANHATSVQAYFDHTYRRVPNQYRGVAQHRSTSTRSITGPPAGTTSSSAAATGATTATTSATARASSSSRASAPRIASTCSRRTRSASRAACS